jgi:hypothetical protein
MLRLQLRRWMKAKPNQERKTYNLGECNNISERLNM